MRLTFVYSIVGTTHSYSHAIAALGGVLSEEIADCSMNLVTVKEDHAAVTAQEIIDGKPDVVLFSAMSNQWNLLVDIATEVRKIDSFIPLVAGGVHLTARPNTPGRAMFDAVVIGEGELAIATLLKHFTSIGPAQLKSQRSPQVISGDIVPELDRLPMPLLDLFSREDVLSYPSVMFSRGCPYRCTYCMSRNGGLSQKVRWKSPQRAIREASALVSRFSPSEIFIDDDTLLKNPKWVRAFSELYKREISVPFSCNARPETVKLTIAQDLSDAGCHAIGIGIESGSEQIRDKVLGRPMRDSVIELAFQNAKAAGLKTWSFNMVGVPGETNEDLLKTIELNDRVETDFVRVSIYTPYPGSPLSEDIIIGQQGYFRPPDILSSEMMETYLNWLGRLNKEGRLWVTESEKMMLLSGLNFDSKYSQKKALSGVIKSA